MQSWDNGMELWNILAKDIKKRVNVSFDGEEIVLAYSSEGKNCLQNYQRKRNGR